MKLAGRDFRSIDDAVDRVHRLQEIVRTGERRLLKVRTELGLLLLELREVVGYGGWVDWLNAKGVHERIGQRAMKLAKAARARFPEVDPSSVPDKFAELYPSCRAAEVAISSAGGDASSMDAAAAAELDGERTRAAIAGGDRDPEFDPPLREVTDDHTAGGRSVASSGTGSRDGTRPARGRRRNEDVAGQLRLEELWRDIEARVTRSVAELEELARIAGTVDRAVAAKFGALAAELRQAFKSAGSEVRR